MWWERIPRAVSLCRLMRMCWERRPFEAAYIAGFAFLPRDFSRHAMTCESSTGSDLPRLMISNPGCLQFAGALDTRYDISYESVISFACAIAVNFDRFVVVDQITEFVNSQVGTLTRSEDCEETEAQLLAIPLCGALHASALHRLLWRRHKGKLGDRFYLFRRNVRQVAHHIRS